MSVLLFSEGELRCATTQKNNNFFQTAYVKASLHVSERRCFVFQFGISQLGKTDLILPDSSEKAAEGIVEKLKADQDKWTNNCSLFLINPEMGKASQTIVSHTHTNSHDYSPQTGTGWVDPSQEDIHVPRVFMRAKKTGLKYGQSRWRMRISAFMARGM